MSTPMTKEVDLLDSLVQIFKIVPTDSNNHQLIEYIAKKKPVILSTAMSNIKDITESFKILKNI